MTEKIYVIHENKEWTAHLINRLEQLNLPYEEWHLDEGTVDLSKVPPEGVFYSRMSASSHTRGNRFAPELTEAVLAWLERHGRKVVNGSRALRLEVSKVNQYMALDIAGIRTPKTIAAVGKNEIIQAAKDLNLSSFITKHNRAGKGLGVQLFHSIEALQEYLDGSSFDPSIDGITLIQEYIQAPEPYITRCEFVGGKFVYAVRVDTSEGFELCPADACKIDDLFCPVGEDVPEKLKFQIVEGFQDPIIEKYEEFLKNNDIQVAGIEFIYDQNGEIFTYDVNTNTNYNSDAEAQADKYGMLELANYLGDQLSVVEQ
ncbi:ATP-grasp domain-containing protein [Virgibacillus necropolis]|uniref:Alpha-L-glutamate ligase n=1 Tax=Virgibacillus necropolis TaxID=163877 RepID=A0A221M7E0_9BACI|nr:alpha-L-glutamate ligase [Virgibacillus necropolis]ASN03544.1 alpha-L-glutamate ligase [Virgibacillus necropolis]